MNYENEWFHEPEYYHFKIWLSLSLESLYAFSRFSHICLKLLNCLYFTDPEWRKPISKFLGKFDTTATVRSGRSLWTALTFLKQPASILLSASVGRRGAVAPSSGGGRYQAAL